MTKSSRSIPTRFCRFLLLDGKFSTELLDTLRNRLNLGGTVVNERLKPLDYFTMWIKGLRVLAEQDGLTVLSSCRYRAFSACWSNPSFLFSPSFFSMERICASWEGYVGQLDNTHPLKEQYLRFGIVDWRRTSFCWSKLIWICIFRFVFVLNEIVICKCFLSLN